jgi:tetratricopeptide (TPR) repeat protein
VKDHFTNLTASREKRRRAAALQNAGAFVVAPALREASWTAPALWRFGIVFLALLFAGNLFAADVTADFSAANKLCAEGKFADAANAYEKILQTGAQSPALLFNDANAEFKCGHLGLAIAAYRRAAQLSPRDDEIRANLAFVRNQVQGATVRESRWQNWFGALTLNEGALLTAVFLWAMFALLIARQIRPALVPRLKTATRIFAFDDAQNAFTARDGAELSILDRREGWVQVADGAGKSGWLPAKQVAVVPGA